MKKLLLVLSILAISASANAEFLASGKVTKFHVSKDNFAVYLTSSKGCPSNWYYSYNTSSNPVTWKMLFDLSLSSYENGKVISIFHTTSNCNDKRFEAIDTIN